MNAILTPLNFIIKGMIYTDENAVEKDIAKRQAVHLISTV